MYNEIRQRVIKFLKRNKKKIIVVLIIWILIIVINNVIKNWDYSESPKVSYKPHIAIIGDEEVPKRLQTPIEQLIENFFNACKNKEYEKAYAYLTEDCKKVIYMNKIDVFKKYVDSVYQENKIYFIQNYSNNDEKYIYNITIINDILKTGMNSEEDQYEYKEKLVISEENGELKIATRAFMGSTEILYNYEDNNMKIKITEIDTKYDSILYHIDIKNKSDYYLVISDYTSDYEISLNTSEGAKRRNDDVLEKICINEEQEIIFTVKYNIFYDDDIKLLGLIFNNIRFFENETKYLNGENPIDDFSVEIKFNN